MNKCCFQTVADEKNRLPLLFFPVSLIEALHKEIQNFCEDGTKHKISTTVFVEFMLLV